MFNCIAVITSIPKGTDDGNLSDDTICKKDIREDFRDEFPDNLLVPFQRRVFELGEILLLDHNGRDIFGKESGGRKPSKWYVGYECFTLDKARLAVERALEVRLAASPEEYSDL